jgi:hypothetical protein
LFHLVVVPLHVLHFDTKDGDLEETRIHALDIRTFLVQYSTPWNTNCFGTSAKLQSFTPSKTGNVTLTVYSGSALEYAALMVAATDAADGWFNVPVLATDDYVTQMATLLKAHIPPNRKIYIEYSNELCVTAIHPSTHTFFFD